MPRLSLHVPKYEVDSYYFYQFNNNHYQWSKHSITCLGWWENDFFLLLKMIFFVPQNKLLNVLITDNDIISFSKLVEVVAKTISFGTNVCLMCYLFIVFLLHLLRKCNKMGNKHYRDPLLSTESCHRKRYT